MNDDTRVTSEQVDAALGNAESTTVDLHGKPHTITVVTMPNGFTVVETSTCVDPANYCPVTGETVNLRRIKDKVWMLMGYELQTKLAEQQDVTKSGVLRNLRALILSVRGQDSLSDDEIDNAINEIDSVVAAEIDYKERVRLEHKELTSRLTALGRFIGSEKFATVPAPEQQRMRTQYAAMKTYADVLQLRISNFTQD